MWRREHNRVSVLKPLSSAFLALFALVALSGSALAQEDGPQAVVERLNSALLGVMQEAEQLGYEGRFDRLEPVLQQTFDFPFMTKVAVGRAWNDLSQAQRDRLIELFGQMSVANFAARFDGYSGERFEIVGRKPGPRDALMIQSQIVRPDDAPVGLDYLLQPVDEGWRIIDVFLDSKFSELARQRSEFSSVLESQGYEGLVASLQQKIENLAAGASG